MARWPHRWSDDASSPSRPQTHTRMTVLSARRFHIYAARRRLCNTGDNGTGAALAPPQASAAPVVAQTTPSARHPCRRGNPTLRRPQASCRHPEIGASALTWGCAIHTLHRRRSRTARRASTALAPRWRRVVAALNQPAERASLRAVRTGNDPQPYRRGAGQSPLAATVDRARVRPGPGSVRRARTSPQPRHARPRRTPWRTTSASNGRRHLRSLRAKRMRRSRPQIAR